MGVQLRPGTNDAVIYDSVVTRNEYRLPTRLIRDSVVIDIGAHAGMFSHLALERGAGTVYAFEPEPANYNQAVRNLAAFSGRVHLAKRAVWRSDVPAGPLHFWRSEDPANAGGGTVIWESDGPLVESVPFDEVVTAIGARINLLKIDCEGAEFPILLTSKRLAAVDRIVGEYHELRAEPAPHARVPGCAQFTIDGLVNVLKQAGFVVSLEPQATGNFGELGLFFADRPVASRGFSFISRWFRRITQNGELANKTARGPNNLAEGGRLV